MFRKRSGELTNFPQRGVQSTVVIKTAPTTSPDLVTLTPFFRAYKLKNATLIRSLRVDLKISKVP